TRAPLPLRRLGQLPHHLVEVEARRLLPDRELLEALEPPRDDRLRRDDEEHPLGNPLAVLERLGSSLERVGAQVVDGRRPEVGERLLPDVEALVVLLLEADLPLIDTDGQQIAVDAPVEELLAR